MPSNYDDDDGGGGEESRRMLRHSLLIVFWWLLLLLLFVFVLFFFGHRLVFVGGRVLFCLLSYTKRRGKGGETVGEKRNGMKGREGAIVRGRNRWREGIEDEERGRGGEVEGVF